MGFEHIIENQIPTPPIEGHVWITMLVKYDLKGKATIVRSFAKAAKDSDIKQFLTPKKKKPEVAINIKKCEEEEGLF